jgi:superfamily II DNA or RNA helicase
MATKTENLPINHKVGASTAPSESVKVEPSSYIGPKGYTIYKECLDVSEQRLIKDELTVRPFIPKSPVQSPAYPVYKENANKFYLPRYYGLQNYGKPEENRIPDGVDINVPFVGALRPEQQHIVTTFINATNTVGGGLLDIPCGEGKTVDACKIISERGKKTLVIVHKEFLLNQWIERIKQFLPTAKVGRIQGQIIDIDDKDIVIGMLQSLSMKEYPDSLFHSFGLTIVDECHHISSEVFCRSLQKIITRYTLGLSATMQRKDGLTKVFKMFLGDIVYQKKRAADDQVLVKAVKFISDDCEFNEMCYDYRGNPAYSTMISKLCAFSPRSEFILRILEKEMKEVPGQQVMILAHNKSLLNYLYEAIAHRGLSTVGYYVGGMKEVELKKSELKQVIIATYAMAAEALDIKTLTTLILATPKTDVVQAVGRILRVKHDRPLVIDIIDSHDVFLSQWQKRRKYYASNNYNIEMGSERAATATTIATAAHNIKKGGKKELAKVKVKVKVDPTNLLGKGVAAAARYINTISEYDETADEPLKGRCFITLKH